MKKLNFFFLLLMFVNLNAQEMQKYLNDTRELVTKGSYEEALQRTIWFHENALAKEPAMKGVRLSFALSDWKSLGEVYPPALKALTDIRDSKSLQIINSGESKELFADVRAINRTLGENTKTVTLFESVVEKNPQTAKSYWHYAKDDLFEAKRYDIIKKFIGNPMIEYSVLVENRQRDLSMAEKMKKNESMLKSHAENTFVEKSLQLIQFAMISDDKKTAKEIQQAALNVVFDYRLRDAIQN